VHEQFYFRSGFRHFRGVVGTSRFELLTCRLGGDRSIQLSYVPTILVAIVSLQAFSANILPEMYVFVLYFVNCGICPVYR
jgi:hypothetical protein